MKDLARWLLEDDLITEGELRQAEQLQQDKSLSLPMALIELDIVGEREIVELMARHHGLPKAPRKLHKVTVAPKALSTIPQDHCWQHGLFPFGIDLPSRTLQVAILDPADEEALALLQRLPNSLEADLYVAGPKQLEKAIRKHFLDSIVEDTNTPGLRFFGYDNITNPGVTGASTEESFENIILAEPGATLPPNASAPPPEPALDGDDLEADDLEADTRDKRKSAAEIPLPPPRPPTSEQAAVRARPPSGVTSPARTKAPSGVTSPVQTRPPSETPSPPSNETHPAPVPDGQPGPPHLSLQDERRAAIARVAPQSVGEQHIAELQQRVEQLEIAVLELLQVVARSTLELTDRTERIASQLTRGLK